MALLGLAAGGALAGLGWYEIHQYGESCPCLGQHADYLTEIPRSHTAGSVRQAGNRRAILRVHSLFHPGCDLTHWVGLANLRTDAFIEAVFAA